MQEGGTPRQLLAIWNTGYGRGYGGAEQAVNALARRLPADRVQILLITNGEPRRQLSNPYFAALPDGIRVHADTFPNPLLDRRPVRFLSSLIQYGRAGVRLFLLFRRSPPGVVHLHFVSVDVFLLALYKYLFGYRLVVTFRGGDLSVAQRSLIARVKVRTALRCADVVTAVSRQMANCLRDEFHAPAVVHVPNGVDCAEIQEAAASLSPAIQPDHFVYVGRLHPDKRVPLLVEIFKESVDAGCDRHLYIVGDGEDRPAVEEAIAKHGLGDHVTLLGAMSHRGALSVLARSRCLVLCSSEEGCPNVVLEAMALGVPAIAPRVGGVPDLMADGETGYLFEADDPHDAARQILRVARDPAGAYTTGRVGADVARRHFDLEGTVRQYLSLYQLLVEPVRPPSPTAVTACSGIQS